MAEGGTRQSQRSRAVWIAGLYATFAGLWILSSDMLVSLVVPPGWQGPALNVAKGWFFVLTTAVLLYLLLLRSERAPLPGDGVERATPNRWLPAVLFALVAFGLSAVGFSTFVAERARLLEDAHRDLSAVADFKAAEIEAWLGERHDDLEALAGDPEIREFAADWIAAGRPEDALRSNLQQHLSAALKSGRYQSAALFDADGRLVLWSGQLPRPDLLTRSTAERAAPPTGEPVEVRLFRLPPAAGGTLLVLRNRLPGWLPSLPAKGVPSGEAPVGVDVALVVDADRGLLDIIRRWPSSSPTAEALLVRAERGSIVFLSDPREWHGPPGGMRRNIGDPELVSARAMRGELGSLEGLDYRGQPVVAEARRLASTDWVVIAKVDRAEVLAPAMRMRAAGTLAILTMLAVAAAGFWLWWRGEERALRLIGQEERLARELLREHYERFLAGTNDVLVLIDGAGRIAEINELGPALYGLTTADLIGMPFADLFPAERRADATRWLAEPESASGSRFESLHSTHDGRSFPVEISSRAIELDGNNHRQALVRDLRDSRRREQESLRLSQIYAALCEANETILRGAERETIFAETCRIAVERGGCVLAWVGLSDEATGEVRRVAAAGDPLAYFDGLRVTSRPDEPEGRGPTGRALRESLPMFENDFLDSPTTAPWRDRARAAGIASSVAVPLSEAGRTVGVLNLYAGEREFFTGAVAELVVQLGADLSAALDRLALERQQLQSMWALSRSEERYRKLFESNPNPMWLYERDTLRFLEVNEAAIAQYGYSRDEFRGMTIADIRPPEDLPLLQSHLRQAPSGPNPARIWRHRKKNGEVFEVEISSYPVDFLGQSARLVLSRDLTAERHARRALAESEAKLRAFFDSGVAGSAVADFEGCIFEANDEYLRIVGATRAELEAGAVRWDVVTPPEFRVRDLEAIAEARARGACAPYEKQYLRLDGQRVWALVGFVLLPGLPERSFAFVLDITARKRAEEDLRRSEQSLREAQRMAHLGSYEYDAASDRMWCSDEALRTVGLRREQFGGRSADLYRFVHPDDRDRVQRVVAEAYGRGEGGETELRVVRPDGQERSIRLHFSIQRDETGAPIGRLGSLQDITEQRRSEAELRQLTEELEQRVGERTAELAASVRQLAATNRELEAFSYSVSHDLRAPLRAIDGFSRLLVEEHAAQLDGEGRRLLGVVRTNARAMGDLIDDLLAFSRVGRQEVKLDDVDMAVLARAAAAEVVARYPNVPSEVEIGELPVVRADPALMRLVWLNLIDNAFKFSAPKPERSVTISCRQDPGRVVFRVRDQGVGFESRYASRLFEVFQRLHSTAEFEGTGVGLALVQRIVQRHGGEVCAEGEVGEGASFYFSLPTQGGAV